jgi:hypothetical protein
MATWIVPTARDSRLYERVVELDGREYVLRFDWSARDESWYLSIYDQDEEPLALSLRMLTGHPILKGQTDPRLPPGQLFVVDTTGSDADPALGNFGAEVALVYEDAA